MNCINEAFALVTNSQQKYLKQFFTNCPEDVKESMTLFQLPTGKILSHSGEMANYIYILLKGKLQGIDDRFDGHIYSFLQFFPISIVDDFEILAGVSEYRITIQAVKDSVLLRIPANFYMKWLKKDANVLWMRLQNLSEEMLRQSGQDRQYLFLQGVDRLALYLINVYEKNSHFQKIRLKKTRVDLSNELGYSLKTLNRSVKRLVEGNYIYLESGKICVEQVHYERLKQFVDQKMGIQ